ncbi:trimeric intracellular cation channel type B-like [Brienomyrus brachyistius]|uniref:trimeric intracellular cation channel type B-like n=1 Tax=Brienomyrus brachyistius TaxID=42636 RepID=UPI0020B1E2FF|nr:trimeric intracellular cation channel type B-like [Brienomyrus brachyistius]
MNLLSLLDLTYLNELALGMSKLSMFPLFDTAHYVVSTMALKEQPGAVDVARRSPFACWFSAMLHCFGGAVLSGLMLAQPSVAPLSNTGSVLLASVVWYLVFYCPADFVYRCSAFLPMRLVLSGMKEVSRTWKVLGGVTQARKQYSDALLVMIAVGWARGAGGGLISNFEQLVRGVWKPETNELLKMSYPTKVTLVGAVLFTLQQSHRLPVKEHHLIFAYTVFLVVNKVWMMLTGSTSSPLAPLEGALYRIFFALQPEEPSCVTRVCPPVIKPGTLAHLSGKNSDSSIASHNGAAACDAHKGTNPAVGTGGKRPAKSSRTETRKDK